MKAPVRLIKLADELTEMLTGESYRVTRLTEASVNLSIISLYFYKDFADCRWHRSIELIDHGKRRREIGKANRPRAILRDGLKAKYLFDQISIDLNPRLLPGDARWPHGWLTNPAI